MGVSVLLPLLVSVAFTPHLSSSSVSHQRDARLLDGFFYPSSNPVGRGSTLQDTMDQLTSSVSTAIDRLADNIEEQVEASLPYRLRNYENTEEHGLEGLEAISGTFGGEGIDDGLRTHFNGDLDGVRVGGPWNEEEPTVQQHNKNYNNNNNNKEESDSAYDEDDEFNEDVGTSSSSSPAFPYQPFFTLPSFNPFSNPWRRPGTGLFDFMNRRPAWWKGPNVCVEREEIDEGKDLDSGITEGGQEEGEQTSSRGFGSTLVFTVGNMQVTSCTDTNDKYTCTSRISRRGIHKTVIVTHKCCHGYVKEGNSCSKVELRSMQETLLDIGSDDFLGLARMAGMMDVLEENITLFVPTNEAMEEFIADLEVENGLDGERRSDNEVFPMMARGAIKEKPMALSHATQGIMYASDLTDEQVLPSLMEGSTLRINTYNTVPPAATVNCARMVTINQHSTHGVVHTIDKVLLPVNKNIAQLISSDPRFSILNRLVERAGLLDKLTQPGQLTLFAPSDAAFHSLPSHTLEALLSDDDNACIEAIVKNHLLPNVICSAAVQGKARTLNLLEEFVFVERTEGEDEIFVEENVRLVTRDVMATNGVMHVVDRPIIPNAAKNVLEVIRSHNLTRFLDLLESADLTREVSGLRDVTIFAPTNKAIEIIPKEEYDALLGDKERLRSLLQYHITTSSLQASDITNNHMAHTHASLPIRVNLYSRSPVLAGLAPESSGNRYVRMTAGCSRVSTLDSRACGAVIHTVERLLTPPKESVIHYLEADEDFSLFTKMIHNTGMNEVLSQEGPFTVLAPTDHVFQSLPEMEYQNIMEDVDLQKQLVKQHVIKEHVCCAGINPNTWLFMDRKRPLEGVPVHLRRSMSGRIMAGNARITYCAPPSGNGLVHTVNHLLLDVNPNRRRIDRTRSTPLFSMPGLEIFFG